MERHAACLRLCSLASSFVRRIVANSRGKAPKPGRSKKRYARRASLAAMAQQNGGQEVNVVLHFPLAFYCKDNFLLCTYTAKRVAKASCNKTQKERIVQRWYETVLIMYQDTVVKKYHLDCCGVACRNGLINSLCAGKKWSVKELFW